MRDSNDWLGNRLMDLLDSKDFLMDLFVSEKNAPVIEKVVDMQTKRDHIMGLGSSTKKSKKPIELEDDAITLDEKLWMSLREQNDLRATNRKERESAELSAPNVGYEAEGYGEGINQRTLEDIIREESRLRGIDPNIAVRVYRKEGLNSYQSREKYKGKRERSYGPFQLFIDGGLGEDYQRDTGGNLIKENNLVAITRQIRWSLDHAARTGSWSPWKGTQKETHGGIIEPFEGLNGAKAIGNWRK